MYLKTMIITANPEEQVSTHFKASEFQCKDSTPIIFIDKELLNVLETVRSRFQAPVHVNSGYRTISYNYTVSTTYKSKHCMGMAADITVEGIKPEQVQNFLEAEYPDKYGIGKYKNFTHIDTREEKSRW